MNKKEMVKALIKDFPGGKEAVAAAIGLSVDGFNNRLYEKKGQSFFSFDELEALATLKDSPAVSEYFGQKTGHLVIEQPSIGDLDSQELYECEMAVNAKHGALSITIYEAELDGVYTKEELKQIEDLERQYIAAFAALNQKKKQLFGAH